MTAILTTPALDVGLITADLESQTRFYGEILGLKPAGSVEIPNVGTITRFSVGHSTLRLMVPAADPVRPSRAGGFAGSIGIGYIGLRIANLAEVVDAVTASGVRVVVPIRVIRSGVQVALVEDAEGNTVELMQDDAS